MLHFSAEQVTTLHLVAMLSEICNLQIHDERRENGRVVRISPGLEVV